MECREITLADRAEVNARLKRWPPKISEHTFTNLYAWRGLRRILLAQAPGAMCFVEERDGRRHLFGPPVGEAAPPEVLRRLRDLGVQSCVRLTKAAADDLSAAGLATAPDRDNADYVYLRRDLAELSGRRYHRQRNLANRCLADYRCEYCEITPAVVPGVIDMQGRWCEERDCGRRPVRCAEYRAVCDTLSNFAEFGLRGGAVRIDGRIEAFGVAEALRPDTAVVHFEKASRSFDGLYQVVNQWLCLYGLADFEFVNREQDMGVPGLRRAKESYHPHHMVDKYVAAADAESLGPLVHSGFDAVCAL